MNPAAHFEVGYIARARGLDGKVVVRTFDPASEVFDEVDRLLVRFKDGRSRELRIEERDDRSGEWVLTFEGIADRTAAEQLVGTTVNVFRADLEPPAEGEFFQGDLVGLEAVDESGAVLGKVEKVWNTGPVPNLVIRGPGGAELLVPFADDFVRSVDLVAKKVVLRQPELIE